MLTERKASFLPLLPLVDANDCDGAQETDEARAREIGSFLTEASEREERARKCCGQGGKFQRLMTKLDCKKRNRAARTSNASLTSGVGGA